MAKKIISTSVPSHDNNTTERQAAPEVVPACSGACQECLLDAMRYKEGRDQCCPENVVTPDNICCERVPNFNAPGFDANNPRTWPRWGCGPYQLNPRFIEDICRRKNINDDAKEACKVGALAWYKTIMSPCPGCPGQAVYDNCCAKRERLNRGLARAYMEIYSDPEEEGCECLARRHNGGPRGCGRSATEDYWKDIKRLMTQRCPQCVGDLTAKPSRPEQGEPEPTPLPVDTPLQPIQPQPQPEPAPGEQKEHACCVALQSFSDPHTFHEFAVSCCCRRLGPHPVGDCGFAEWPLLIPIDLSDYDDLEKGWYELDKWLRQNYPTIFPPSLPPIREFLTPDIPGSGDPSGLGMAKKWTIYARSIEGDCDTCFSNTWRDPLTDEGEENMEPNVTDPSFPEGEPPFIGECAPEEYDPDVEILPVEGVCCQRIMAFPRVDQGPCYPYSCTGRLVRTSRLCQCDIWSSGECTRDSEWFPPTTPDGSLQLFLRSFTACNCDNTDCNCDVLCPSVLDLRELPSFVPPPPPI